MTASDPAPQAPLHEPVERFRGCHGHIVGGLQRLRGLPELAEAMRQARATAAETLALFEHHVLPHHGDEEKELFVAVSRSAADGAERHRVDELVARLVSQHRAIEGLWTLLRPAVLAVAAGKAPAMPGFEQAVASLVETYLRHTQIEEREFLPLADTILGRNPDHLAALDLSLHIRHMPMPKLAYM